MPDLSIFFDIEPKLGLERILMDNNREVNRLDKEKMEFHTLVREGYNLVYNMNKDRIVKIDASKSIEDVFSNVKKIISKELNIK